ncbi:MAG: TetR/AcrR family transcriptional regulator [Gammaproteobacteria bacterium]|nr:TetR/AcrR family transcriptional regulator [Gammaproteobacteria bacterium]
MPYSKEHKQQSREKILQSASELFPRKGYEAVSIDELMIHAGLTRGAFYSHFSDKSEIYAESIIYTATRSPIVLENSDTTDISEWFDNTIGQYLSPSHVTTQPSPCPLAFLVTDINKREKKVRNSYTQVYKSLLSFLNRRFKSHSVEIKNETTMTISAIMIGGVALANALDDKKLADKLLRSCRKISKDLIKIDA